MATRKYPARGNPAPGVNPVDAKYLQPPENIWRENNLIVKSSEHFQFFFVSLATLMVTGRLIRLCIHCIERITVVITTMLCQCRQSRQTPSQCRHARKALDPCLGWDSNILHWPRVLKCHCWTTSLWREKLLSVQTN